MVFLEVLKNMHAEFDVSKEYLSNNGKTRLVDLTIKKSNLSENFTESNSQFNFSKKNSRRLWQEFCWF